MPGQGVRTVDPVSPNSKAQSGSWPWIAISAGWLLWGLFNVTRLKLVIQDAEWELALRYGMPDAVIWALLTPIPVLLARRFPIPGDKTSHNVVLHLVIAAVVAVLHTTFDTAQNALWWRSDGESPALGPLFLAIVSHTFHLNILLYLAIVGITLYLKHLKSLRERERQTSELRARLSEVRLEALRTQLRPHFLFNALHTVSGLMETDPAAGRRVVRQLGELLRAGLSSSTEQEIPLRKELELAQAYLGIEQVRFQDRLQATIEADQEALDCAVPAFILQPLVENAVRHGVAPKTEGGTVSIVAGCGDGRLTLEVRDDGVGLEGPASELQEGIGLSNTRARLRELYPDRHRFELEEPEGGGLAITVTIPRRSTEAEPRS